MKLGIEVWVLFFPVEVVFGGGLYGAVAQALRVVSRHHDLDSREEVADEVGSLVLKVLVDAFGDIATGVL